MNFPHLNFGNNFVSMHQFSSATKVVGNVQQNISFIPSTSTQHYPNHCNHVGFPSNVQVSSAMIQHQHHYQDTCTRLLNSGVTPLSVNPITKPTTSTAAQTQWTDNFNRIPISDNARVNLPNFSHHNTNVGNHITQTIERPSRTVVMQSVSTMTDFEIPTSQEQKCTPPKEINLSEESDDSSKSSSNDNNALLELSWSNPCSKINLKTNASAMAVYLSRLQPVEIPQNIKDFLKHHNIELSINKAETVNCKKDNEDNVKNKPEMRLFPSQDGSFLYGCSECNITYPQKELIDRHLSEHKVERRFECNVCGICLKRKEHLDQHKRGHSEERPFVCGICCKGFKRNEHLRRHIVIHSGNKNHVCIQCGKAFSRKDHLSKHFQTHISKRVKSESIEPTSQLLQLQTHENVQNSSL